MNSIENLNEFELAIYPKILEYWKKISNNNIDFSSKKSLNLLKDLNLLPKDYEILKLLYNNQEK
jgi:hypothetical protein